MPPWRPPRHALMTLMIHQTPTSSTSTAAARAIVGLSSLAPTRLMPSMSTRTSSPTSSTTIGAAKVTAARRSRRYAWPRPGKMKLSAAATTPDRSDFLDRLSRSGWYSRFKLRARLLLSGITLFVARLTRHHGVAFPRGNGRWYVGQWALRQVERTHRRGRRWLR